MRTVMRILKRLYGPVEAAGPAGVTVVALGYENWWVAFSDADQGPQAGRGVQTAPCPVSPSLASPGPFAPTPAAAFQT